MGLRTKQPPPFPRLRCVSGRGARRSLRSRIPTVALRASCRHVSSARVQRWRPRRLLAVGGGCWGLTERRRLLLELTGRLPVATWPWVPAAWQPWEVGQAGPRQAGSGWGGRAQRARPHVFLEGCRPSAGAAPPRRSQGPRTRCCQCSRLRIWNRDYCGAGSIPGLGTATCQGCGREKKKKVSQKKRKFRNIQALY